MLSAAQRLRRREEFAATIRAGRRAGRGVVVVHLDAPDDLGTPQVPDDTSPAPAGRADLPVRAGFVVPKTVGKAVARNKVRRRLRHLIRERLDRLPPGATVVVRALPGAADRAFPELAEDLDAALIAARRRQPRRSRREGR
ncbi:ribonuclease P protein component [Planosporangium mesophilum]|uniref:Ribonuclease P protein component n=1 Tax=Planosporangium mesophilum TaxID=689768 RepID=A0A8J3TCD3_9ACTN|nr:ribonuclease P protein component [Planosporangium mesophilum]NJC82225.1 ribonuclease P protein component [Planosporangium mesophilum]GII22274.1 ribonuclease P protein component [Planosporangium mesophilum]